MKKLLLLLLALVLSLSTFVSCNTSGTGDPSQTDGTSSQGESSANGESSESGSESSSEENTEDTTNSLTLLENGRSEYQIVYSVGQSYTLNTNGYEVAQMIQNTIAAVTGVTLPVTSDQGEKKDQEILVGFTNRTDEYDAPEGPNQSAEGYSVFLADERVVLEAGSNAGVYLSAQLLLERLLGINVIENPNPERDESKTRLSLPLDYQVTEKLEAEDFPYLGYDLSDFKIYVQPNEYFQKRAALHLQRHMRQQESVSLTISTSYSVQAGNYFLFRQDDSLKDGAFQITHQANTIFLTAGDYNGYTGAITALLQIKKELGFYPFRKGETLHLSHVDYLSNLNETSAYAYNRVGDYRLMFYNVLWDNSSVEERGRLQVEMIKEYAPDVIGFQEFKTNRRAYIVPALKQLGYAETMLYTSVASKGADYYNYVPIFYNTATTECIESGYLRYNAQYSEGESKSKSMTWAVMKSKTTQEKYIVVNTHMCTQDDTIRGKQAVEAITVVNSVLQKYPNLPTFLGGDYNGKYVAANFKYFASTGGFTDIESNNLAEEFTCKTKAHHQPYTLELWDGVIIRPESASPIDVNRPHLSVDHIMVRNKARVKIGVYGVVVDDCTDHGGDHYPIFIDFTIQ